VPLSVALISTLVLAWLARRLYLWDPVPKPLAAGLVQSTPAGIGGWLLIPLLGLPIQAIQLGRGLYASLPAYEVDTWRTLTDPSAAGYHSLILPLLLLTLIGLLAGLMLSGLDMLLALRRRSSFPRMYIAGAVAGIAVLLADLGTMALLPATEEINLPKEIAGHVRAVIVTLIWIAYVLRSRRVRATFVQPLSPNSISPAVETSQQTE
jgi:hypothetical protein